jgi:hypothetical protein
VKRLPQWAATAGVAAAVVTFVLAPAALAQEEEFDRIAAETAAARELPPLAEIDEAFLTPAELAARLPEMIAEDYPPEKAAAESRSWVAMGLVPAGTDLSRLYLTLLGEQVAGFYDPETKQMFVISDGEAGDELGALQEYTYSHEVVHALQDEHLGLSELVAANPSRSDDAALALTALYEGDAMAASFDYLTDHPMVAMRIAFGPQPDSDQFDQMPPAVAMSLVFPYFSGQAFVEALRAEGGWAAVDAAYSDMPVSTEQILHPEKYLERDEPTAVALPDLAGALGAGWSVVDEDTAGELLIAVLLAEMEPGQAVNGLTGAMNLPAAAAGAAAGWDGDRYALWVGGEDEVLVWQSVWDSDEDAAEFMEALSGYAERRFGATAVPTGGTVGEALVIAGADQAVRIARDGATVRYVVAPTADLAEQVTGVMGGQ